MRTIRITGTGSALPGRIVTNKELEQMVETSDEWIRERTGIGERHVSVGETVVTLASEAARKALEQAGKRAEEIDLILVATCSPEQYLPCCACQVQAAVGAVNALAFDVNAACSGFLFALNTADAYLRTGLAENALVIGSEVLSKLVDWTDRGSCILFGDGVGAVVVKSTQDAPWYAHLGARGERDILWSGGMGSEERYLHMNGQEVFKFALETVPQAARTLLAKAGMEKEQVDWYVLHQANHRIVESVARRLKVPLSKCYENIERYGNTSAGTIPIALDEMAEQGLLKAGQWIMCLGFGSGMTWGGALFQWQDKEEK